MLHVNNSDTQSTTRMIYAMRTVKNTLCESAVCTITGENGTSTPRNVFLSDGVPVCFRSSSGGDVNVRISRRCSLELHPSCLWEGIS